MKTFNLLSFFAAIVFSNLLYAQTWTQLSNSITADIWGVSFLDDQNGWISCSMGQLYKTTDGGQNWTALNSGVASGIIRNITMFDLNNGWAVGDNGLILHTTNGGTTWTPQTSNTTQTLRHVSIVSTNVAWVCGGNGTILHTTDGGANWTAQTSNTTVGLMSMDFVNATNGWVVGSSGGAINGIILHTTDGGTTWTQQSDPNNMNLNVCKFSNATTGWSAGPSGIVYNTTDGGTTWNAQTTPFSNIYRAIDFVSAMEGWIADDLGNIIHTTDGGTNWTGQSSVATHFFRNMDMVSNTHGYAVGNSGLVVEFRLPSMSNNAQMTSFNTTLGTPSASQSFQVNGTFLSGNITVTAPADFEVSTSAGSGFGSSLSLIPTNGTISNATIYVRYNPSTTGTHSGNVTISSSGAANQSVAVDGTCSALGIQGLESASSFKVYPNPSSENLFLEIPENIEEVTYSIFTLDGQVLKTGKVTFVTVIDLSSIDKGSYLIQLTTAGHNSQKTFIKN